VQDQLHHLLGCEAFLQLVYMLREEVDADFNRLSVPENTRDRDMYLKGRLRGMLFFEELLERSLMAGNKEKENESAAA